MSDCDYLIVDDDQTFAGILAKSLTRRGLSAAIASDEAGALARCRQHQPDRVILDLKLEQISGLTLISKILDQAPEAKIVILTGYSSIPTTVEAIKLGAVNYLCKPASVADILDAFEESKGKADVDLAAQPPSLDRLEWEHIQRILAENEGNISATARVLGMHRRTLQRKLQKRPVKS